MLSELRQRWAETLADETGLTTEEILPLFERPRREGVGDVALPCFRIAKRLGRDVKELTAKASSLLSSAEMVERADVVGGYLNIWLKRPPFTEAVLKRIGEERESFGSSDEGNGKTILIDFSSPNIAKPFGVGHLRSTVLGAALGRIFRFLGYRVVGINYLGDWGMQVAKMLVAYQKWFDEAEYRKEPIRYLYRLYVRFHDEEERNEGLTAEAQKTLKALEEGDRKTLELWKEFMKVSRAEFQRIYSILGVEFEQTAGESMCDGDGRPRCVEKMDAVIKELVEKGLVKKGEGGALIVEFGNDLPPLMLRKSDGATLYATREIAVVIERWRRYRFHKMLYVVGVPQKLHFRQVFRLLKMAGYEFADRCEHIEFGHYIGMSTRRGTMVLLEEVLEELVRKARRIVEEKNPDLVRSGEAEDVARAVAVGALIFNDLKNARQKDVVYDEERFLSFDGETGPYLQYAHTRLCGILRKYGKEKPPRNIDASVLSSDEEWSLVMRLDEFPEVVRTATTTREPSHIANYLLSLASAFNLFYQRHRVLTEDETTTKARIRLIFCLKYVLGSGLRLLGIQPLERM